MGDVSSDYSLGPYRQSGEFSLLRGRTFTHDLTP